MLLRILILALVVPLGLALPPGSAQAAQSYDNCTGYIDSIPATITTQGTWCLRKDLSTALTTGAAITVATNNVTIDCNDFKLGGLAAGVATATVGIFGDTNLNTTVRRCNVRGFLFGVGFEGQNGGHVVEDNRFDANTSAGIYIHGDGSVVRRNLVRDTGGSTVFAGYAHGIYAGGAVDIIDNTIAGVLPSADGTGGANGIPYGIYTVFSPSGSIVGNRIRGLQRRGASASFGIFNWTSNRIQVRDNDIVILSGGSFSAGVVCEGIDATKGVATGNIVNGFETKIENCQNDGSNL